MATLYNILVFIHIFSAILGMGPGFVLTQVTKPAKTMTELRHAYIIKNRLHVFVMVGGSLLLITGLLMGLINPSLFRMGWYNVSLLLFLIGLAAGPLVLKPLSKPIKELLSDYQGNDIPAEYFPLARRLEFYENIASGLFLVIIALMILKPF